ncbi:MAG: Trk family potassium uptake protein [Clostridia bacterium]|nr:Trk family potassium uptake protein [Clostridia bacterium]
MKGWLTETKRKRRLGSTATLLLSFLVIILVGAVLLCMPFSSNSGEFTNPLDALFTSVSATCVTGLVVFNTAVHWSLVGQIVILVLIQVGGIGVMTMAVFLLIAVRRLTPKERIMITQSYNLPTFDNTSDLLRKIALGTFLIEAAGAGVLYTQFSKMDLPTGEKIWRSVFTSVSAFCNAGFDLMGETGMSYFADNVVVNLTMIILIVTGGLGFIVWSDLWGCAVRRRKPAVYTKLVLICAGILLLSGTVAFSLAEWNNEGTIGALSPFKKIMGALFHSASLRTAGFAMFDNACLTPVSRVLSDLFMFIGGASGSTAGGVKTVTVAILLWSVFSIAFGNSEPTIFKRRIPKDAIIRSSSVIIMQGLVAILGIIVINAVTDFSMEQIIYEVISAISTVGNSMGITPALPAAAKVVIIFLMYFGRVGILSITCAVMESLRKSAANISYPEANLLIG